MYVYGISYFHLLPANPSLHGGGLTFSRFQEIQEAKNDLRTKGVTVD